ncbi:hypothetical protein [Caudoviricetes sp.]|nr:hypothetical protein [Caudoviricetes sp.]UOF79662.1 hypothetical protein [Caudoviricetes sp.]UOF79863.1 hypothetical protein [Bacteriophage sp.]UOF81333.1 hypothetical protein [Caudoviricetes sp.]
MQTTLTGIWRIVSIGGLVLVLNGCGWLSGNVQLVNDSREIRPGTEQGWVQISEGYLRDLVGLIDLCLHPDRQRPIEAQEHPLKRTQLAQD